MGIETMPKEMVPVPMDRAAITFQDTKNVKARCDHDCRHKMWRDRRQSAHSLRWLVTGAAGLAG